MEEAASHRSRRPETNEPVSSDEVNQEYEVEKIMEEKVRYGRTYYLVKWTDYPPSHCTWEPAENLENCIALEEFLQKQLNKTDEKSGLLACKNDKPSYHGNIISSEASSHKALKHHSDLSPIYLGAKPSQDERNKVARSHLDEKESQTSISILSKASQVRQARGKVSPLKDSSPNMRTSLLSPASLKPPRKRLSKISTQDRDPQRLPSALDERARAEECQSRPEGSCHSKCVNLRQTGSKIGQEDSRAQARLKSSRQGKKNSGRSDSGNIRVSKVDTKRMVGEVETGPRLKQETRRVRTERLDKSGQIRSKSRRQSNSAERISRASGIRSHTMVNGDMFFELEWAQEPPPSELYYYSYEALFNNNSAILASYLMMLVLKQQKATCPDLSPP